MIVGGLGAGSLWQSPGEAEGPSTVKFSGEDVSARRVTRQIVVQSPSVASNDGDVDPPAAAESSQEPSGNFRARQVEHWIAQIAGAEAGGMPFVLLGGGPEPEPAETGLGRLYEEF
jgi:hypothetical protein